MTGYLFLALGVFTGCVFSNWLSGWKVQRGLGIGAIAAVLVLVMGGILTLLGYTP